MHLTYMTWSTQTPVTTQAAHEARAVDSQCLARLSTCRVIIRKQREKEKIGVTHGPTSQNQQFFSFRGIIFLHFFISNV